MNALADPSWGDNVFVDAKWAERYEREVIGKALSEMFCRVSTLREDQKEATDFVTQSSNAKWASRMRRLRSAAKYRDVTIRSKRPSGAKTEIDKILSGAIDLYMYAWISDEKDKLEEYLVFDVKTALDAKCFQRGNEVWNRDGSSAFIAIDTRRLWDVGSIVCGEKYPGAPVSYQWVPRSP